MLTVAYGVPLAEATAITILDWVISVLSIIVLGAVLYVVSPMPRGEGRIKVTEASPEPVPARLSSRAGPRSPADEIGLYREPPDTYTGRRLRPWPRDP